MLSTFSCASWPSVCFLWRNVYLSLRSIFDSVVCCCGVLFCFVLTRSCISSLYTLEIKPLSVAPFANIFSHSMSRLFILLTVSFAGQKLVSLIRSYLFIFTFISFTLGDWPRKILLRFMSENVLSMFSSRSFMVSYLTLKSLSQEFLKLEKLSSPPAFIYRQNKQSCLSNRCSLALGLTFSLPYPFSYPSFSRSYTERHLFCTGLFKAFQGKEHSHPNNRTGLGEL